MSLSALRHGFLTVPQKYNLRTPIMSAYTYHVCIHLSCLRTSIMSAYTYHLVPGVLNLQTHYKLSIRSCRLSHKCSAFTYVSPLHNSDILHRHIVLAFIPLSPDTMHSMPLKIMTLESWADAYFVILLISPLINRIHTNSLTCVLSMTAIGFLL